MDNINDTTAALHATEWGGARVFMCATLRTGREHTRISTTEFDRTFFKNNAEMGVTSRGAGARATISATASWDYPNSGVLAVSDDITTPEELLAWARMVANLTQG